MSHNVCNHISILNYTNFKIFNYKLVVYLNQTEMAADFGHRMGGISRVAVNLLAAILQRDMI